MPAIIILVVLSGLSVAFTNPRIRVAGGGGQRMGLVEILYVCEAESA